MIYDLQITVDDQSNCHSFYLVSIVTTWWWRTL